MKTPWEMNARELHAYHATQVAENLSMIDTANAPTSEQDRRRRGIIAARSSAGDEDRLRMIPVHARGVPGAIPGSNPNAIRWNQ